MDHNQAASIPMTRLEKWTIIIMTGLTWLLISWPFLSFISLDILSKDVYDYPVWMYLAFVAAYPLSFYFIRRGVRKDQLKRLEKQNSMRCPRGERHKWGESALIEASDNSSTHTVRVFCSQCDATQTYEIEDPDKPYL